jgi:hypothetical protein
VAAPTAAHDRHVKPIATIGIGCSHSLIQTVPQSRRRHGVSVFQKRRLGTVTFFTRGTVSISPESAAGQGPALDRFGVKKLTLAPAEPASGGSTWMTPTSHGVAYPSLRDFN